MALYFRVIFFALLVCVSSLGRFARADAPLPIPSGLYFQDVEGRDYRQDLELAVKSMHSEGFQVTRLTGKGHTALAWTDAVFTSVDLHNVVFLKFNTEINDPSFEGKLYTSNGQHFYHGITSDQIPYMLYFLNLSAEESTGIVESLGRTLGASLHSRGLKKIMVGLSEIILPSAHAECGTSPGLNVGFPDLSKVVYSDPLLGAELFGVVNCLLPGFDEMYGQLSQHFAADFKAKASSSFQDNWIGSAAGQIQGLISGTASTAKFLWGVTTDVAGMIQKAGTSEANYLTSHVHKPSELGPTLLGQFAMAVNVAKNAINNFDEAVKRATVNDAQAALAWNKEPLSERVKAICSAIGHGIGRQAGNVLGVVSGTVSGVASWLLVPIGGEVTGATKIVLGLAKGAVEALKAIPWAVPVAKAFSELRCFSG